LGRQTTEMIAGATPIRTSVNPNLASSMAMDMSIAAARPIPPATQCPAIRPTYGLGDSRNLPNKSVGSTGFDEEPPLPEERSERSAPAQNTRPRLVSTTTRTSGSESASSSASVNSVVRRELSALRLSSSARVTVSTPLARLVSTAAIRSSRAAARRSAGRQTPGPGASSPARFLRSAPARCRRRDVAG